MPNLWTPKDLAEYLNVSPKSVYRWIQERSVPHILLASGKRKETIRFQPAAIDAWLAGRRREATNRITRWDLR